MRTRFLLVTAACGVLLAQTADDVQQHLVGRAFTGTAILEDLHELCDGIGGRPTGSPACNRAIDWAVAKFRAAGADSVVTETFTVPKLWLPEAAEAECMAPERFVLRVAAAPHSDSTNGPIEARLVDAGEGSPDAFAKLGASTRGAIALVMSREMRTFDDLFAEYTKSGPMLEAARKAGVAALLLQSTRPHGLLYRHPLANANQAYALPAAIISREQAGRLARLAAHGDVRVHLRLTNKTGSAYESRNVVAEIAGLERPEEIVLLGAHLDSWDLGTGAEDNGANSALVIDVLRGMKALGLKPRRTIRFVLFTGEEQGMFGSAGYVLRHATEMDRHNAVVIFDIGTGRTSGFLLNGREELRAPLEKALAGVAGLDAKENPVDGLDGTDNFDFLLSGVPNLVANQDAAPYLPQYHAESDTVDRVNARELRANTALASALVWWLAEDSERFGRRQTRDEVMKLLIETRLDSQMKAFGQWEDFQGGRRGVGK
ncbi:MAG TPA: M20/M25/M40 family metallo-hydrolase [Candidatus Acidoferrales bacterium]|nr:M20/M25/M40 family metallo-hydrolase [Candidatus Acidoferrales bacterium]